MHENESVVKAFSRTINDLSRYYSLLILYSTTILEAKTNSIVLPIHSDELFARVLNQPPKAMRLSCGKQRWQNAF